MKINRINFKIILLFVPCFIAGFIGMFGVFISASIFRLFNSCYKLPEDKAWIDVAPITSYFWKIYIWYMQKILFKNI